MHQHAGVPGPHRRDRGALGGDRQAQHCRKDTLAGSFGPQDPLQLPHPVRTAQPGESQRAPCDSQRDAQRRLVRTVSGHIADHDVHRAVGGLHEIVEVAAEQCILPARPVLGDDAHAGLVQQQRRRQQTALQPCVLPCPHLAGMQVDCRELGALAFDRVQHRAAQHLRVDAPFDQIVLGAGGDGRDPEVLVVETGQHHHGNTRVLSADPGQSVDPVGVVQMQVQQDAVGSGGRDLTLGVGHGRRPGHVHVDAGIGDQLLDDDRVSAVVFDQQQRQRVAAVRDAAGSRRFGGSAHVTRTGVRLAIHRGYPGAGAVRTVCRPRRCAPCGRRRRW